MSAKPNRAEKFALENKLYTHKLLVYDQTDAPPEVSLHVSKRRAYASGEAYRKQIDRVLEENGVGRYEIVELQTERKGKGNGNH